MAEPAASRFEACLDAVLTHEGGYADHQSDPGGATNMGITRKTLATWRGVAPWQDLDKAEVRALKRQEASQIYRRLYWGPIKADSLPAGLDLALFDFAVNSGVSRAAITVQRLLGVKADGVVGPVTLSAIKTRVALSGAAGLIDALCGKRLTFLQGLSTFAVFGRGWEKRVAEIRAAALASAATSPKIVRPQPEWSTKMPDLSGYKTYIVAAFMVIAGLAQIAGVDLPALDGSSAGQLIMEALAIIFLRKGLKGDIAKA